MKRKNKVSLLPYIREDVFSLSTDSPQIYGWQLTSLNIPKMWTQTKGEDVVIAVIDTGCDIDHEDIKSNIIEGINFVKKKEKPYDKVGHGTHVASTIAACDNGKGVVGVAPKSKIMPIKALGDDGTGIMNNIIDGIIYAADNNVDFITMSLGSPGTSPDLEKAIAYASSKGCIVFCAAGNSGENVDVMYPAKSEYTIAIGAIDENFNRTNFTCSGDSLDFLAPGHNILACVPNNNYALMSGTSMSNPCAVGIAALLLSFNKKHNKYILNTYNDYIDILKTSTKNLTDPRYAGIKKYQGYGIMYPVL